MHDVVLANKKITSSCIVGYVHMQCLMVNQSMILLIKTINKLTAASAQLAMSRAKM